MLDPFVDDLKVAKLDIQRPVAVPELDLSAELPAVGGLGITFRQVSVHLEDGHPEKGAQVEIDETSRWNVKEQSGRHRAKGDRAQVRDGDLLFEHEGVEGDGDQPAEPRGCVDVELPHGEFPAQE